MLSLSLLPSIMERTFVALKPDGVQRGLCGEVMKRFEQKGFRLVAAKFLQVTTATETRAVVQKDPPFVFYFFVYKCDQHMDLLEYPNEEQGLAFPMIPLSCMCPLHGY